MSSVKPNNGRPRVRRCPNCGKPSVEAAFPFCSKRCADLDLGRWLNEDYRIPVDDVFGDEDEVPEDFPEDGEEG